MRLNDMSRYVALTPTPTAPGADADNTPRFDVLGGGETREEALMPLVEKARSLESLPHFALFLNTDALPDNQVQLQELITNDPFLAAVYEHARRGTLSEARSQARADFSTSVTGYHDRAVLANERLGLARRALVNTGYWGDPNQVGDDVAPRITEFASYCASEIEILAGKERDAQNRIKELEAMIARADLGLVAGAATEATETTHTRTDQPCSTCDGVGTIETEHQAGAPGSGGTVPCPDCTAPTRRFAGPSGFPNSAVEEAWEAWTPRDYSGVTSWTTVAREAFAAGWDAAVNHQGDSAFELQTARDGVRVGAQTIVGLIDEGFRINHIVAGAQPFIEARSVARTLARTGTTEFTDADAATTEATTPEDFTHAIHCALQDVFGSCGPGRVKAQEAACVQVAAALRAHDVVRVAESPEATVVGRAEVEVAVVPVDRLDDLNRAVERLEALDRDRNRCSWHDATAGVRCQLRADHEGPHQTITATS